MRCLFWLFLFIANAALGQTEDEKFLNDFLLGIELKSENTLSSYLQHDFSVLWSQTPNHRIVGIIGEDHQRIKIKLTSIQKAPSQSHKYIVTGKSCVKGTICKFTGTITIEEVREVKELDLDYSSADVQSHGLIVATYEFKENAKQQHSGVFKGTLYSKWLVDATNELKYDDVLSMADGYSNNAFVGIWKSYTSGKEKISNWADGRVPKANKDFDIGTGEFGPSEKYYNKGWGVYVKAWARGDIEAQKIEREEWW